MFEYKVTAESSKGEARIGEFTTAHGVIETPVFMPCGTKAAVKTLTPAELKEVGTQVVLGNTYHLHLRPTSEYIKERGGLHKFMNWDGPILTDSGGYQVFSLREMDFGGKNVKKIKIKEDGVKFYSYMDGSAHFFTPDSVMQIQANLGADIIMAFDECAPGKSDHRYAKQAMDRTHRWAKESVKAWSKYCDPAKQTIFPIVQGVTYEDLRVESAKFMADLDTAGVAIGGLSVGEGSQATYDALDVVMPHLPKNKPRYLMGVGSPENLVEAVYRGVDMFDCVLPTRLARHGTFWDETGRHHITNTIYKDDDREFFGGFSYAYMRHLFVEDETLGKRILSLWNLKFLHDLTDRMKQAIREDKFEEFRKEFYSRFNVR